MRKAFISPTKYVQGENELVNLGYFIKTFGDSALLIAHQDDITRVKDKLEHTIAQFGVTIIESGFNGECSRNEVHRLKQLAKEHACSCTIGLGGGKAIDTAKCVAEGEALIIVPTIAATDAPTSHSAVLYTPEGEFDDYAYFKQSPSVVLIDTNVIANAPTRFLVAGMGDALSTYFEARATANSYSNVNAGLPCGANAGVGQPTKGTRAALALAKLCYETLLEDGLKAKISCDSNIVTPALENIIETNILLSGLGFESGGLAAAHAIHNGLTALEGTHSYYHGEKVAFSTLVQLVLENANKGEINEVLNFCVSVGLPVCLADIGVTNVTRSELLNVAQKACILEESIHSMPFPVTEEDVVAAIMVADQIGQEFKKKGE
ncbi:MULTISPECIES: glycerol dehydrogenase [Brevibacillus]|uniref:Glycerol dehydrogenase n=4 Tax=Brevibacillus laterosporus TaxID=1465 RepID=A0AAP8QCR4_BRELA|nr:MULTISPECIES: glycerol dehydrogenase [Brevibacillus]MCG7317748.1 glycerol dehydrogenase [Brevibacillus laterosporus]MCR8980828.1 glycerol dehydrogenase [Brevibacillus laterosporus]MCZ0807983.1 glycerol dehydrogenase [Brevibacillus laterosporus]MCZ0826455.1 glycerol dehydrogenase [Brevibacillus laterosporus]MCZ0850932.1 glycerol dehydrogenase [Brevibacillus laterosporus]